MDFNGRKIGVCGHFNKGFEAIGGQTIKTRLISENLKSKNYYVEDLDTEGWKKRKLYFFYKCVKLMMTNDHVIILPAANGAKILIPLFSFMGAILRKNVHYIVIGGWLPSLINNKKYLKVFLRKINYIYVETKTLKNLMEEYNFRKVFLLPNFKETPREDLVEINSFKEMKLCTMSRINENKGIIEAIKVVERVNQEGLFKVSLDIYGPIEDSFETKFKEVLLTSSEYISYKGNLPYEKVYDTLKNYYLLLFPTKYYTEGLPGTLLDALMSGVPTLASRWQSWQDVLIETKTGYTYEFNNQEDFYQKLHFLVSNREVCIEMRKNCIVESKKFLPDNVMKVLISNIKEGSKQ